MASNALNVKNSEHQTDPHEAKTLPLLDDRSPVRFWSLPLFWGLFAAFLGGGAVVTFSYYTHGLLRGDALSATPLSTDLIVLSFLCLLSLLLSWQLWRQKEKNKQELALMQATLEAMPNGQAVVDQNGHIHYGNQVFWDFFQGFPIEDQIQGHQKSGTLSFTRSSFLMTLDALQPFLARQDDQSILKNIFAQAEALIPAKAELAFRGQDDKTRWHEVSVLPICRQRRLWKIDDIKDRRAEREHWKEAFYNLSDLIDDLPVGVYSVDENGSFLYANRTFLSWLGCDLDFLVGGGLKLSDIIADRRGIQTSPHDPYSRNEEEDRNIVCFLTKDGDVFESRVQQTVYEMPRDVVIDGDPVEEIKAPRDLRLYTRTVVRRLSVKGDWEEALRRSEHRFQQIFENAPVGILLVDTQAQISAANRAFREMVQPTKSRLVVGQPLLTFVEEDHKSLLQQRLRDVTEGKKLTGALEVKLTGKAEIPAAVFVSQTRDVVDKPTGFILHFLDATEQKRLELQFAQSQKMQAVGQLAGGVAHDFNNMLTAITGHCDLLMQRHHPGEAEFSDISQIRNASNRAANLVRQLLAFSRKQALRPQVLDLTDALAELTHMLKRLIGENIKLNIIHGRDLFPVRVDLSQMENVIINLAVNARDAINDPGGLPSGMLTIRTDNVAMERPLRRLTEEMPAGDYVLIEVIDTGCGIEPEILQRIFEPFFTTKEVGSGTGLGLSTVYGIIKQFDGFLFVDSKIGEGTTFSIYLPRYELPEMPSKTDQTVVDVQPSGDLTGSGTVLLVEDEEAVRLFSTRALRQKGYHVLEAGSGEQALQILETENKMIDLLITDVVMPQMDGPEMVRQIRENRPDLKVIFISGYAEDNFRERLDQDADIHFLPKPFSLKQLAGKVRDVLGKGG